MLKGVGGELTELDKLRAELTALKNGELRKRARRDGVTAERLREIKDMPRDCQNGEIISAIIQQERIKLAEAKHSSRATHDTIEHFRYIFEHIGRKVRLNEQWGPRLFDLLDHPQCESSASALANADHVIHCISEEDITWLARVKVCQYKVQLGVPKGDDEFQMLNAIFGPACIIFFLDHTLDSDMRFKYLQGVEPSMLNPLIARPKIPATVETPRSSMSARSAARRPAPPRPTTRSASSPPSSCRRRGRTSSSRPGCWR